MFVGPRESAIRETRSVDRVDPVGAVGHGASLARWNEALRIEASLRPAAPAFRLEAAARMVH